MSTYFAVPRPPVSTLFRYDEGNPQEAIDYLASRGITATLDSNGYSINFYTEVLNPGDFVYGVGVKMSAQDVAASFQMVDGPGIFRYDILEA
jgi:hypothetical protein